MSLKTNLSDAENTQRLVEFSTSDKMICQDLRMDFRVSSGSGRRYS